jgi:hypothetical protein
MPPLWQKIHRRLIESMRDSIASPPPPIPLILAGWVFSNDLEKQQRWQETIAWAESHGCSEHVRDLPPSSMYVVEKISDQEIAYDAEEEFGDGA